jgi:hypothetical protein
VVEGDKHLKEMGSIGQIVARLIKEAMTESRTYEHTNKTIEEERFELLVRNVLLLVESLHNEVGSQKAEAPEQTIPADAEGTYGKSLNGGLPVDEKESHFELGVKEVREVKEVKNDTWPPV